MTRMKDPYAAGWNAAIEMLAAHCDKKEAEYNERLEEDEDEEQNAFLAGHGNAYWSLAAWARNKAKPEDET